MRTYVVPVLFAAVAWKLFSNASLVRPPGLNPTWPSRARQRSNLRPRRAPGRFDSDSDPIGVNSHTSKCMASKPYLFEDLHLNKDKGQVNVISDGLEIEGKGTFKFNIMNDEGKQHTISIANSLYVPKMRRCLLSSQHWAQEARDKQTWMELKRQWPYDCVLNWRGGKKAIPHHSLANVPVFYTASSLTSYRAFAATFEVMEASFFQQEKVLQYPGCRDLMDDIKPEKFVAEENLNKDKEMSVDAGVIEDDKTIKPSNIPLTAAEEPPTEAICRGPLTFNPTPHQEEDEDTMLATAKNQVILMRWHYRLGHLPFAKLKQLALNSEFPKKLAKVAPPKCNSCLFGAMTKIPWRGKETKASHKVFVATKLGGCVSVDQMMSSNSTPNQPLYPLPYPTVLTKLKFAQFCTRVFNLKDIPWICGFVHPSYKSNNKHYQQTHSCKQFIVTAASNQLEFILCY